MWRCWAKIHGTHNAPFFLFEEFDFPRLEKYCFCDLVIVGNGEPLMIACSNMHVSIATLKLGPTRLASLNRNPRTLVRFSLFTVLLNFFFQKCRD